DDDAGQAKPGGKIKGEELQQRAQRQMRDDQERARGDQHRYVALERDLQKSFESKRLGQHDEERDDKQRRQLAGQRNDRVAARGLQPLPGTAAAKFGADRIARRERDDDM